MIYFSSDQHWGHDRIREYCSRDYSSVEEMNQALIDNHNAIVKSEDTTYHLGDFSMSDKIVADILKQLNGSHILICGNHDKCHPCHKKKAKTFQQYIEYGFKEVYTEMFMDINGLGLVKFNHLPYINPGFSDTRYDNLKPIPGDEKYLFHGHVHNSWKLKDNMLNLGVDVWGYRPVSIDEVVAFLTV